MGHTRRYFRFRAVDTGVSSTNFGKITVSFFAMIGGRLPVRVDAGGVAAEVGLQAQF